MRSQLRFGRFLHPPTRGDEFDAGRATSIETCETTKNETCGKLAVAGFCQSVTMVEAGIPADFQ